MDRRKLIASLGTAAVSMASLKEAFASTTDDPECVPTPLREWVDTTTETSIPFDLNIGVKDTIAKGPRANAHVYLNGVQATDNAGFVRIDTTIADYFNVEIKLQDRVVWRGVLVPDMTLGELECCKAVDGAYSRSDVDLTTGADADNFIHVPAFGDEDRGYTGRIFIKIDPTNEIE